jgi:hypothetical protein
VTVRVAVCTPDPLPAAIVSVIVEEVGTVEIGKRALVAPGGTDTLAGTITFEGS